MQKDTQLIIFDFDGVVVDSEIISATVLVEQFKTLGVEIDIAHVLKHYLGRSFASMRSSVYKEFNVSLSEKFEYEYREALFAEFSTKLDTTSGFKEMFSQLSIDYCIATSSDPVRAYHCLELVGLTDYLTNKVFTASQVKNGKPAPDLFLFAAAEMNVTADKCLVVEDSAAGLAAAQAANMQAVHYQGGLHLSCEAAPAIKPAENARQADSWQTFMQMHKPLFNNADTAEKLLNLN